MAHSCDNKANAQARLDRVTRSCGGRAESKKEEMREHRAKGGKVKGKSTNVTIVIGSPQAPSMIPPDEPEMRSGPVIPPPPPMPPGAGPMPPMPRANGGKVEVKSPGRKDGYPAMDYGSLTGKSRLQKVKAYGGKK